jgi:predicted DNA-binding protein YlxM (UPF0122 family)
MKIPIRNPEKLQAMIDRRVEAVERAGRLFTYNRRKNIDAMWGRLSDVYKVVSEAGRPVDYRYVTYAMGFPLDTVHHWRIANRLGWLTKRGYLREAGRGPIRYRQHGAKLFTAVPLIEIPIVRQRVERAIAKLLKEVERPAQLVNDVTACVAARIGDHPYLGFTGQHERNMEMIRLRLAGKSLTSIADKYGVSRERVRQIVERAVERTPIHKNTLKLMQRQPFGARAYAHKRQLFTEVADAILRMPKKFNW